MYYLIHYNLIKSKVKLFIRQLWMSNVYWHQFYDSLNIEKCLYYGINGYKLVFLLFLYFLVLICLSVCHALLLQLDQKVKTQFMDNFYGNNVHWSHKNRRRSYARDKNHSKMSKNIWTFAKTCMGTKLMRST